MSNQHLKVNEVMVKVCLNELKKYILIVSV